MKILIIEDEINAFEYLQSIIQRLQPDVEVVAHLESVEDSINWLHQNEAPDLIFLDIQLADGLSFEIFNHVEVKTPIIFTTAFDQYAIDAFKVNSIDYLLKPIHIDDLKQALDKFEQQQLVTNQNLSTQLAAIFGQLQQPKKHRCLIKKGNHFEFINIADIAFVNSEDGLTFLHTFDHKRHLYNHPAKKLMEQLDTTTFFQINRGQIVNINAIQKIHPYFNNRLKLELTVLTKDVALIVSRPKIQLFRAWVDS